MGPLVGRGVWTCPAISGEILKMDLVLEQLIREATQLGPCPAPDDVEAVVTAALTDRDYWQELVDELGEVPGRQLHWPDTGVRVVVTHRKNGQMSPIHSHECWVALTPLQGVETHRLYQTLGGPKSPVSLVEERHLQRNALVTLIPPNDIHSHGHPRSEHQPGHTLIVLGDAQEKFLRYEYDPITGEPSPLPPGQMGTPHLPPGLAEKSPL
jgi:predicted metal-dependent enzyme (double-stranded beta helix superfamily)